MVGVHHLHDRGVAHRDIKLENIFLDSCFAIWIGDFGFATEEETSSEICGTWGYLSPQVHFKSDYSPQKSDIFACGCLLVCLLSGSSLFGEKPDALMNQFQEEGETWLVRWCIEIGIKSKALIGLLTEMLAWDEESRPSAEEILQHEWMNKTVHSPKGMQRSLTKLWRALEEEQDEVSTHFSNEDSVQTIPAALVGTSKPL